MEAIVLREGVHKIAKNAKFWRLITGLKNGGRYLTGAGVALTESGEFCESRICARQRLEEWLREEVFWGAALGETAANQDPYAALLELVSTSSFFWSLPKEVVHPDSCLTGGDSNSFLGRFQADGADPQALKQLSEAWNALLDPEIMAILHALETLEEMPPTMGLYGFLRGVTGEERARSVELVRRTPVHFLAGFFQSEPDTCHRNPWGNPLHLAARRFWLRTAAHFRPGFFENTIFR